MVAEDAGRDPRSISPYTRGSTNAPNPGVNVYNPADAGNPLRFWRWAEADSAFGVSGQINNPNQVLSNCGTPWQTTCAVGGNNAGNNDEIYGFHPGGANAVFGDGSVKFLKATTNVVILRSLVTLNSGEVISADQY
jgi:prepilin-type processing-associated H-X9-DG protein